MDGDIKLFDEFDWTPALDAQMLALRQTGMTIADMAAQMCCSKRKLIYRLEVLKPPRIAHETWTHERVEYLKAHYPAGVKSAHQIGLDLGLTKNQVIGKAGRLGLQHGIKPESALFQAKPYVGGPSVKFAPATGCQYHEDEKGWCGQPVVDVVAWNSLPKRSAYCLSHHKQTHYHNSNHAYRNNRPHQTYTVAG
jgi:hypothetical protein